MSKHLSETTKKRAVKNKAGFMQALHLYPSGGADADGYLPGYAMLACLLGGLLFFAAASLLHFSPVVKALLYALSLVTAGAFCILNVLANLRMGRFVCEALPVLLACVVGFAAKCYAAAFFIMLFYQLVKLLEAYAVRAQRLKARDVLDILPEYASVLNGEEYTKIKPAHIREGDLIRVEAGEIIPVDGVVEDGISSVDMSPLVCDKKVVAVAAGHKVAGGCVNLSVPLLIRASCDYSSSTSQQMYASFSSVIRKEGEDEKLARKASNILLPVFFALALVFGVIVPLIRQSTVENAWVTGAKRAVIFLLAACPYSLPEALSLNVFTAVSRIFSAGAVIKDIHVLSKLAKLETFVCNKTCTVSESEFTITEVCPNGISEEGLLSVLVKVESQSSHPVAQAIRKYAGVDNGLVVEGLEAEEIPCKGISAKIGKSNILAGNATLLYDNGVNCPVPEGQGSAVHVAINGTYCGYVLMENPVRSGIFDAIEQMRACGVRNFAMLSGDLRSVVRPIASSLNFNVAKAELTPEGKENAAAYLAGNDTPGKTLAFAGDGTNEKLCFAKADVTVMTSALGNEEAFSTDVTILGEGITHFPPAVKAGRSAQLIALVSMAAQFGARLLFVILALFGVCPLILSGIIYAIIALAAFAFASFLFSKV